MRTRRTQLHDRLLECSRDIWCLVPTPYLEEKPIMHQRRPDTLCILRRSLLGPRIHAYGVRTYLLAHSGAVHLRHELSHCIVWISESFSFLSLSKQDEKEALAPAWWLLRCTTRIHGRCQGIIGVWKSKTPITKEKKFAGEGGTQTHRGETHVLL